MKIILITNNKRNIIYTMWIIRIKIKKINKIKMIKILHKYNNIFETYFRA